MKALRGRISVGHYARTRVVGAPVQNPHGDFEHGGVGHGGAQRIHLRDADLVAN